MNRLETCFSFNSINNNNNHNHKSSPRLSSSPNNETTLKLVRRARIPLEYHHHHHHNGCDDFKRANKIRLSLREDQCKAFEMGGEFPTQVVAITSKIYFKLKLVLIKIFYQYINNHN